MSSLDFWRNEAAASPFPREVISLQFLELKGLILSAILGATFCAILFESVLLYILFVILLGFPIRWAEARANQPYLCAFGTLFWIGHLLTRVVAALARSWLSTSQLSPLALQATLIGMSAFTFTYVAILVKPESSGERWRNPSQIEINWPKAVIVCGFVALLSTILIDVAGGTDRGLPINFGPVFNIIAGIKGAVYLLPSVLLGLSLFERTERYRILIGISWLIIFAGTVLSSGREVILKSVFVSTLTWSMFQSETKRVKKFMIIIAIVFLFIMMVLGSYRSQFNPYLSTDSRIQRLWGTIAEFRFSTDYLRHQTLAVADRLYELPSIQLMHFSSRNQIREPWYALDQLLFMYVPKFLFPEKGSGTARDLLYELGFVYYSEVNSAPVVLLADAYYRGGMGGIVIVYALTGLILTWLAKWLWRIDNPVLASAFMSIIGYGVFRGYVLDVYRLLTWWFYNIPKQIILLTLVFIVTDSFNISRVLDWLRNHQDVGAKQ